MILEKELYGLKFRIIVRHATNRRLEGTCFRSQKRLAGNFSHWNSVEDVLGNQIVLDRLLLHVKESRSGYSPNFMFCINLGCIVGWESTDYVGNYAPSDLEAFGPNHRSQGLRIKMDRSHLLAPKTFMVSILYEFKVEKDFQVIIIHSIYPGQCIGKLVGDITVNTGRVFFDWNHPGA